MENKELKIGDKVLGSFCGRHPYAVVTDLTMIPRTTKGYDGSVIESYTDLGVSFDDGNTYRTRQTECFQAGDNTLELSRKSLYVVNGLLGNDEVNRVKESGYFGKYSKITYNGKDTIVYVDRGESEVNVVCPFFDKIFYNTPWSGDYRWNHDKPLVVFDEDKGFNLLAKHSHKLLCDEWLKELTPYWNGKGANEYLSGINNDGKEVVVSKNGIVIEKSATEVTLDEVKSYGEKEINEWISSDRPCGYVRGLDYKGALVTYIDADRAKELYKTHNVFGGRFNSAEWRMMDNQVVLVFIDYCDSDYD